MTVISGLGRHFLFLCFHCGNWQNAFFVYAMSEFFGTQVFLLATPADASWKPSHHSTGSNPLLPYCSHHSSPPPAILVWSSLFVSCKNHPGGDLNLILRDAITLDFFGSLYPLWDIVPCNLQILMEWNIHCDLAPPPSKRDYSWIVVEMMTVLEGLQFVWHNNRHHRLREMKMPRSTNVGSIIRGRQQYWSWWGWSLHKPLLLCIYPRVLPWPRHVCRRHCRCQCHRLHPTPTVINVIVVCVVRRHCQHLVSCRLPFAPPLLFIFIGAAAATSINLPQTGFSPVWNTFLCHCYIWLSCQKWNVLARKPPMIYIISGSTPGAWWFVCSAQG